MLICGTQLYFSLENIHEMVKNVHNSSVDINNDTRKNKTMEMLAN